MKRTKNMKIIFDSIFISLAIVVAFVWGVFAFNGADRISATDEDYLPLEQQISMVEKNPQSLLKNEGEYTVEEEKLVAVFSNDECQITAEYKIDESGNLELVSTKKSDKRIPTPLVLGFALISGTLIGCAILALYSMIKDIVISINYHVKTKKENSRE